MKATDLRLGVLRQLRWHRRKLAAFCVAIAVFAAISALEPSGGPSRFAVVTTREVTGGATIGADDVAVVALPESLVPESLLDDATRAIGKVATVTLPRGAILVPASVVTPEALVGAGMAMIPVTLPPVAAGLVDVGDRLDLVSAGAEGDTAVVAKAVRVVGLPGGPETGTFGSNGTSSGVLALVEVPSPDAANLSVLAAAGPLAFVLITTGTQTGDG
ncbi:MAG: hypothetical protein IPL43_01455 [Micropruina sp.]|nr:hypothetical protein [Micropruina sp.]